MKLPENMSKIIGKRYNGQKDDEGRPHGHGTMEYSAKTGKKYRYEGHFEHGVRSGYGVWHESSQFIREYEPWEWAQMGEYDSAGRLIHPNTRPGPHREVVEFWDEKFRGWWKNDDAVHDLRRKKYADEDFEFTEDDCFLSRFIDFSAVRKLSMPTVSKLFNSDRPYARYAYGAWLWTSRKDSISLRNAFEIFEETAREGVADALQMLSRMYYLGEAYDRETGKFVMDRKLSRELNSQAIEKGSLLARLRRNRDLFYGATGIEADRAAALKEAEREASHYNASVFWSEQAGWFHEAEGETEKAIKAYEKCIINGYYSPICDLALIYLEKGDDSYYETLMKVGMQLGVPDCLILGIENESRWESLNGDERLDLYRRLKRNLTEGVSQGSGYCAYVLADAFLNGKFGFDIDLLKGKEYAEKAMTFGYNVADELVIEAAETLQDPDFIPDEELLRLRMDALRYGSGAEIRGAVIIALEDNRHDTHPFHFQEDIDNLFAAISDMTGGLARRV